MRIIAGIKNEMATKPPPAMMLPLDQRDKLVKQYETEAKQAFNSYYGAGAPKPIVGDYLSAVAIKKPDKIENGTHHH